MNITELINFRNAAVRNVNLNKEIDSDVYRSVFTPRKSLPYFRSFGTDILSSINRPVTILSQETLRKQVIDSVMIYNDSTTNQTERRVVLPSENVKMLIEDQFRGEADLTVQYIRVRDLPRMRPPNESNVRQV